MAMEMVCWEDFEVEPSLRRRLSTWRAMAKKASSTLASRLAEASKNGMPYSDARFCPASFETARLLSMSALLPTSTLFTLRERETLDLRLAIEIVTAGDAGGSVRFGGVGLNVAHPVADVGEGGFIGDVVHKEDAMGTAVVGGGDGAEALLASSVPDLELGAGALEVNGADFEVNTNGGDERRLEVVL